MWTRAGFAIAILLSVNCFALTTTKSADPFVLDCTEQNEGCYEPRAWGSRVMNVTTEETGKFITKVTYWVSDRGPQGWVTQKREIDVARFQWMKFSSLSLSGNRLKILGYTGKEEDRWTIRYSPKTALFEIKADGSLQSLEYADMYRNPVVIMKLTAESGDFQTFLVSGRTSYACEESRCEYGYTLFSNVSRDGSGLKTEVARGSGRDVQKFGRNYFRVKSDDEFSIYSMKDASPVVRIPIAAVKLDTGEIAGYFVDDDTFVFLGSDGTLRELDLTTGKTAVKVTLAGVTAEPLWTSRSARFVARWQFGHVILTDYSQTVYYNIVTGQKVVMPEFAVPTETYEVEQISADGKTAILSYGVAGTSDNMYLHSMKTGKYLGVKGRVDDPMKGDLAYGFRFINEYGDIFSSFRRSDRTLGYIVFPGPKE